MVKWPRRVLKQRSKPSATAAPRRETRATEIMLQRASIVAIVGELVSAGVPEHVRVDAKRHPGGLTEALDEPVEAYGLIGPPRSETNT